VLWEVPAVQGGTATLWAQVLDYSSFIAGHDHENGRSHSAIAGAVPGLSSAQSNERRQHETNRKKPVRFTCKQAILLVCMDSALLLHVTIEFG